VIPNQVGLMIFKPAHLVGHVPVARTILRIYLQMWEVPAPSH
jgi:hypothetical protein